MKTFRLPMGLALLSLLAIAPALAASANPLVDIRGIFPASTPIPRAGLSTESQAQAKLCEGGNAQACSFLANQFDEGTGAPKNDAWAATLYVRACGGGNAIGCGSVGSIGVHDVVPKERACLCRDFVFRGAVSAD